MCPAASSVGVEQPVNPILSNNSETIEDQKPATLLQELVSHLNLLQVARLHNDRRLVSRVIQHLPQIRRQLTVPHLSKLLENPSINGKFTNLYFNNII